jgi:hypothetical protein
MIHKQNAVSLLKPWPQTVTFKEHLRELVANLKHVVEIPLGYQDETGFHFGEEPRQDEVHWPRA